MSGIQEAKRGANFQCARVMTASNPHSESEQVTLQLSKDGSTLQVATETCTGTVSVRLLDIKGLALHVTPLHSFSLQLDDLSSGNNVDVAASVEPADVFVAPTADVLNRWVVALTCGVNAFQQHQSSEPNFPDAKAADLVWQAVRLRIFELAGVMALPTAIEHVTQTIPDQDYQQSEALRHRVGFLQ